MMKKLVAVFLLIATCLAFVGCNSSSIGIIGGADGPTDIIVEQKEE